VTYSNEIAERRARPADSSAASQYYEGRDLEAMAVLSRYYRWMLETFAPYLHGHGVEIGAGQGTMSRLLVDRLERLHLVEPSSNLFAVLRERFSTDPRVTLQSVSAECYLEEVLPQTLDTVVMVNVLEHIEDDRSALIGIERSLRPGGYLLIFVPALRMLYSKFDRLVGHHRRYHLGELNALVSGASFEIVHCRYCDVLGVVPWLILNRLLGSTRLNPTLIRIYDAVFTPTTRLLESLIKAPFGKNLILVARKPAAHGDSSVHGTDIRRHS
jgi:SAM-dependent methyltransferase